MDCHVFPNLSLFEINIKKSKVVVFKRGGIVTKYEKWHCGGERIEVVKNYKYLGLVLSNSGSFTETCKGLANQGCRAFYSLRRSLQSVGDIPVTLFFKLFDCKILPILHFNAEVWGLENANEIEKVHHLFCKFILKVPIRSSNCAVRAELGRTNLYVYRAKAVISYWLRILNLPASHFCAVAYRYQYSMAERGIGCWALSLKHLLFSVGFGECWIHQGVANSRAFMLMIEQRLKDIDLQNCIAEISNNRKLYSYSTFKINIICEKYLSCINIMNYRRSLCNFRISSHNLNIETGRWNNIPRNLRLCTCCNLNEVEDEYHFLLICPTYFNLRQTCIPESFHRFPSKDKFSFLMQSKSSDILNNLGKFLFHSFKKRKMILLEQI
ncbi:MAG: hypothetical protein ACR2O9_02440 [Alphaproteobacteria bacterium]